MGIITNKIYICLPVEKEIDKLDWDGLSTEEYNGKTYYKIPSGGNSSDVVKKITFETFKDNVTVTLNIVSSSENGYDYAYACDLDGTSGYNNAKYKISGNNKSITCEYVVPTKGSHWIYIGYRKDSSGNQYNDCGYFNIDIIDKEYVIRQPKEVYLASDKMNEITYGSKKIFEYGLNNTISWETLTWDKSNNSYTYNTNGPIKIKYKITSVTSTSKTLNKSPDKLPLDGKVYKLDFYSSIISNNTYIMPYKIDLSNWDNSYVHDMVSMFYNFDSLNYINLSKLKNENITSTESMFYKCKNLKTLDVSGFNTSNVTNMSNMFYYCSSLTSLDVSKFDTSKVTNMQYLFFSCLSLTSLDLSKWDTSKVTNMTCMFYWAYHLNYLDVSNFNTSNVTMMDHMFSDCKALTSLDLSKWDVSNVTNMNFMFSNCSSLTTLIDGHESDPNVSILNGLKNDISLKHSTKLNYKSVYALFRGLATVTSNQTITLPKVMEGKLDATKVKIAKDKGWTIVYE